MWSYRLSIYIIIQYEIGDLMSFALCCVKKKEKNNR